MADGQDTKDRTHDVRASARASADRPAVLMREGGSIPYLKSSRRSKQLSVRTSFERRSKSLYGFVKQMEISTFPDLILLDNAGRNLISCDFLSGMLFGNLGRGGM